MRDWKKHWEETPLQYDEERFLEQVGKTVNKKPISRKQFEKIVACIRENLDIKPDDDLLDLCCGNGIITWSIAAHCKSIIGVDYSSKLLDIARRYHTKEGIEYINGDIRDAGVLLKGKVFGKAYMYEALQHFSPEDLPTILDNLRNLLKRPFFFLAGSVPDNERKWDFYDTEERRKEYKLRVKAGNEAIGTWWEKPVIREICEKRGLEVEFFPQDKTLHTAHYRFDMLIRERD